MDDLFRRARAGAARPPRRLASAVVWICALTLALASSAHATARPRATTAGDGSSITIDPSETAGAIRSGFLGVSFEYWALEHYAGTDPEALDPVLLQLLRNLDPGQAPVIRIGGVTTDRTWWPAPACAVRRERSTPSRGDACRSPGRSPRRSTPS